jgi:dTDP-glucose pyrophosphorylase
VITYAFDHLLGVGVERLVVNTHHRAEAYDSAFPERSYRGVPIDFRNEHPHVLETAGGIKNVQDLLGNEPFFVYNGDILSDLPLEPALRAHRDGGHEVTLVLRSKDGPLQVSFDHGSGRITDIGGRLTESATPRFLFTGIYLVNPEFFARILPATKISVIPIFLEMIRSGALLGGVVIDDGHWWDLGTREQVLAVHRALAGNGTPRWIAPSAAVGGGGADHRCERYRLQCADRRASKAPRLHRVGRCGNRYRLRVARMYRHFGCASFRQSRVRRSLALDFHPLACPAWSHILSIRPSAASRDLRNRRSSSMRWRKAVRTASSTELQSANHTR